MKIICLGDSLTYGFSVARKDTWVHDAGQRLERHTFVNRGVNGDTTGGMLARLYRDTVLERADMAVVMGGSNDFMMGCDLPIVRTNMMAMANQLAYHRIKPVIGIPVLAEEKTLTPRWKTFADCGQLNGSLRAYRQWILTFSRVYQVEYVDFQAAFEKAMREGLYLDGLHLNREGHEVMAGILCEFLENRKRALFGEKL